jgi:Zn-dependent peptidase ImmA (M78 family)
VGVARIDLADAGSPERLVAEILKREPDLPIPVPIEKLCSQLDILDIKPLATPGFEGALITDRDKHTGIILYNQASPRKRRRFTIGHELCHFLAPSHVPNSEGRFLCSQSDMLLLAYDEQDRRRRMEVEANRFASLLLLPPPRFRRDVDQYRDASLQHVIALSEKYLVSLEAVSRAYVTYRSDLVAVVITQNSRLLRYYKDERRFPFITAPYHSPVPHQSLLLRKAHKQGIPSEPDEVDAGIWIDVVRGRAAPTLYEQVCVQNKGFALIMLTVEQNEEEEYDRDAERTAKERYRDRRARWSG